MRRHARLGYDVKRAPSREKFIADMRRRVHVPTPIRTVVKDRAVYRFPFLEMVQDLLNSPKFDDVENICVNKDALRRFMKFIPVDEHDNSEAMAKKWASMTFDSLENFDIERDFFLPLILYADKTGTDQYQRYPLEPWMFTFALFRRAVRESPNMWRHLGFMPPSEDTVVAESGDTVVEDGDEVEAADSDAHCKKKSQQNLQLYHYFLSNLLAEIKQCKHNLPELYINLGGVRQKRRVHFHVMFIVGDQKSQDCVCGRVCSNLGGAGRIHRACMCSAVRGSDASTSSCSSLVNIDVVKSLNHTALLNEVSLSESVRSTLPGVHRADKVQMKLVVDFVCRTVKLARALLARPYTLYPLRNGFDGVPFGVNEHGVTVATAEDELHSCEAGVFLYLNTVAYGMMTASERKLFESQLRNFLSFSRSSSSQNYPLMKLKQNFTNQSLMTHTEKVGNAMNLLFALHHRGCREVWDTALLRQQTKYKKFPSKAKLAANNSSPTEKQSDRVSGSAPVTKAKRKRSSATESPSAPPCETSDPDGLPAACFPFRKDTFFASDRTKSAPFDRTDTSISFVCEHLRRHGFNLLLRERDLDELQLDQLMTEAWGILKPLHSKTDFDQYPSQETVDSIGDDSVRTMFQCVHEVVPGAPSPLEESCKARLRRNIRSVDVSVVASRITENASSRSSQRESHQSVPIKGCIPKHGRKRPTISGNGFTGTVLSDTTTFLSYIEYVLCYHAWCHYSHLLPVHLQNDLELIDFGSRMVVQYFDTLVYRGDSTVDSDTCKLHSQLHIRRLIDYFGGFEQCNSGTGERGLKLWAKFVSRTARKWGIEIFTGDTANRITEQMLMNTLIDASSNNGEPNSGGGVGSSVSSAPNSESDSSSTTTVSGGQGEQGSVNRNDGPNRSEAFHFTRQRPHFTFERGNPSRLVSNPLLGSSRQPDKSSGSLPKEVMDAIMELEKEQNVFNTWCEADLGSGQYIRCWPSFRSGNQWHDWVCVSFDVDSHDDEVESDSYPAKVLAFYEDKNGAAMALVHSVDYKTLSKCEGPFGDSRLVTHYRKEFQENGRPSLRKVPASAIHHCLMVYESIGNKHSPLPRPVADRKERKEHTVMVIRRREEWAKLFLDWTKEIKNRREDSNAVDRNRL